MQFAVKWQSAKKSKSLQVLLLGTVRKKRKALFREGLPLSGY
jgi:hypothetical protein